MLHTLVTKTSRFVRCESQFRLDGSLGILQFPYVSIFVERSPAFFLVPSLVLLDVHVNISSQNQSLNDLDC